MTVLCAELVSEIDYAGVYPQIVRRTVEQALGAQQPQAWFVLPETTFDADQVFRHVTVVLLTKTRFARVHIDDGNSRAIASFDVVKLENIRTHAVSYVYGTELADAEAVIEVSLSMNWSTVKRLDLEPAICGDSQCTVEHGLTGSLIPDDLQMRVSTEAEGERAVRKFSDFVDGVSDALSCSDYALGAVNE